MACSTISKFTFDVCESSLGGIRTVYLANWKEDAALASEGEITGFTSGITWYEYGFRKNTGSMTHTLNVADDGSNNVTTVLSLVFGKMDTQKRIAMSALANADIMAIVVDNNGERTFLGKDCPVNVSNGTGETGTNRSDANRFTMELTDDSKEYPLHLASDVTITPAE